MSDKNKALVRNFVETINAQDWPLLHELVADDFTRHSTAGGSPGTSSRKSLIEFLQGEYMTFPDATEALEDLIAEGNKVAARHRFRGTQMGPLGAYPASGRVLEATYLAIYRIEEDRIAEAWVEWDNLAGLRQLGHPMTTEPSK
jgi:steroid delta-isomerase-like uncharacterized protein